MTNLKNPVNKKVLDLVNQDPIVMEDINCFTTGLNTRREFLNKIAYSVYNAVENLSISVLDLPDGATFKDVDLIVMNTVNSTMHQIALDAKVEFSYSAYRKDVAEIQATANH